MLYQENTLQNKEWTKWELRLPSFLMFNLSEELLLLVQILIRHIWHASFSVYDSFQFQDFRSNFIRCLDLHRPTFRKKVERKIVTLLYINNKHIGVNRESNAC